MNKLSMECYHGDTFPLNLRLYKEPFQIYGQPRNRNPKGYCFPTSVEGGVGSKINGEKK